MSSNKITKRELDKSILDEFVIIAIHRDDWNIHLSAEEKAKILAKPDFDENSVVNGYKMGLMTPEMFKKLFDIEEKANKYTHPNQPDLIPGTYCLVTVDGNGHVVLAENGKRIDAIAKDSEHLEGLSSIDFVKSRDGVLLGKPQAPTPLPSDSSNAVATTKFVQDAIKNGTFKLFEESHEAPSNKYIFWVDLASGGVMKYFSETQDMWVPIVGVFDSVTV